MESLQKDLQKLLNRQMTRKEFVRHIGMMILSVFGVAGLLRYLAQDNYHPPQAIRGYGVNSFGGRGRKNISLHKANISQR